MLTDVESISERPFDNSGTAAKANSATKVIIKPRELCEFLISYSS
jgi:hypothetical protein